MGNDYILCITSKVSKASHNPCFGVQPGTSSMNAVLDLLSSATLGASTDVTSLCWYHANRDKERFSSECRVKILGANGKCSCNYVCTINELRLV